MTAAVIRSWLRRLSVGGLATLSTLPAAGDQDGVSLTLSRAIARLPEDAIAVARAILEWQSIVGAAYTIVSESRAVMDYVTSIPIGSAV